MNPRKIALLTAVVLALGLAITFTQFSDTGTVGAQNAGTSPAAAQSKKKPDVHFVPTPQEVVDEMLKMAGVHKGDVLYDLGSGDGRIPITAAQKFGIRAVGIDIDPQRIAEAEENAKKAGVTDKVKFRNEDLFETDFREATVVTLYLLQTLNERLKPKLLKELKPGTRIVSHAFTMGEDWPPEKTAEVDGRMVYMWTVPKSPAAANAPAKQ